jgi:hypothetical protein
VPGRTPGDKAWRPGEAGFAKGRDGLSFRQRAKLRQQSCTHSSPLLFQARQVRTSKWEAKAGISPGKLFNTVGANWGLKLFASASRTIDKNENDKGAIYREEIPPIGSV